MRASTGATIIKTVVIVDRAGQIVADFEIEQNAAGWQRWREQVAALGAGVAACVETSQGMIIEQLLESGVSLYPISPVSTQAYRERKALSGNKSDHVDAWSLADALRVDGHGWRRLGKEDPLVAELRLLCRDEVALIEERTALVNQLQSALQEYYPAALEAFEDWTLPGAWAFLESFATRRCSPRQGNANGKSSSTAISLSGRKPMPNAWRSSLWRASWSLEKCSPAPRAAGADPHRGCCACSRTSSRPTALRSRSSLPSIPITSSLVRSLERVRKLPHAS